MSIIGSLPYTLTNGQTADATQVMADFNTIISNVNTNAAHSGANSDITSLSALSTPVPQSGGGTGVTDGSNLWQPGDVKAVAYTNVPAGWLACQGQAVNRATYAALFAAIGTQFGAGDGATTFNVPDGRGRAIAGYDPGNATGRLTGYRQGVSAAALGNAGGEQAHAQSNDELSQHAHNYTDNGHAHVISAVTNAPGVTAGAGAASLGIVGQTNPADINIIINNTGTSTPGNVVQPTLILNYLIKT